MLTKTEIYISIGVFLFSIFLVNYLLNLYDKGDFFWASSTLPPELSFSPLDMVKAWIITKNDFVNGKYIYSSTPVKKKEFTSRGELECKRVLEEIFKVPFTKVRPAILRNNVTSTDNKDNNLELDCYNEELKLAVEYNGIQHYKYQPYFHKNHEAFLNQKYRDEMKRTLCERHGIILIEVPYFTKDIETYILEELKKYKFI